MDDHPNGAELSGLFAYLRKDDEVRAEWMAYAIVKAFGGGQKGQKKKQAKQPIEDDEVIDTTDPSFERNFRGFVHTKSQPRRPRRPTNTEIKLG